MLISCKRGAHMCIKTPRKKLEKFGKYLKSIRQNANLSQKQVANELKRSGLRATQSYIAQIEDGQIVDPQSELLNALAHIYGTGYKRLVLAMVEEKYCIDFSSTDFKRSLAVLLAEKDLVILKELEHK